MTPPDVKLKAPTPDSKLTLYRLARVGFATLAGSGSALYPGRWNLAGQRAVYTSLEIGTCVLERLVHESDKGTIPDGIVLMRIELSGRWSSTPSFQGYQVWTDATSGCSIFVFDSLLSASLFQGSRRLPIGNLIAIFVPSAAVPVYNVVLYPDVHGFEKHTELAETSSFIFDPRLFIEGAELERKLS